MKRKCLGLVMILLITTACDNFNKLSFEDESVNVSQDGFNSFQTSETTTSYTQDELNKHYQESWIYKNEEAYYDLGNLSTDLGAKLKTKLYNKISGHTTLGYKSLNTYYQYTDLRSDGSVWDMYGDFSYNLNSNACGNYGKEGDCWNKEHSMPKSWFNDASPMSSDIYHIFPTDGKINGMRSNYPFGEVKDPTYTYVTKNAAKTGLTITNKLGSSAIEGYSGVVFEPDDIYKGDFARAYFYMVTAYENKVSSWKQGSTNLGGNAYPGFNKWSVEMLLKWAQEDPISEKEINRVNQAYKYQKNRNPYVDNQDFACRVFGPYNDNTRKMCSNILDKYN